MKSKILTLMIIGIFLFSLAFVSANLGTYTQGECVDIKTILNTSSVTLSTLSYPNGNIAVSNKVMTNIAGKTFNYTYCSTNFIGTYNYDYYDASGNVYVNSFEIGGNDIWIFIILSLMGYLSIVVYSFNKKLSLIKNMGCTLLMVIGVIILRNNIVGTYDLLSLSLGIINVGMGFFYMMKGYFEGDENEEKDREFEEVED